jgi:release factor glutamine methyltransferase
MSVYLKTAMAGHKGFDVIISNPPYIPTDAVAQLPVDVRNEPRTALDGGADGLHFYREIFRYAHQVLSPQGFLICEIGDGQRPDIERILAQYPQYRNIQFFKDYVETDRIMMARANNPI